MGSDLSLSITALTKPELSFLSERLETSDQYLAVQDILFMGEAATDVEIRAGIECYYVAAKDSLAAVWPVVVSVAKALLKHTELDYSMFSDAVAGHDIYTPVFKVQDVHGLWQRWRERTD